MLDAEGLQFVMFRSRCDADHLRADVLCDLRRRYADAAAGRMNEHVSPRFRPPMTTTNCQAVR